MASFSLPRSAPEAQGVSSAALTALFDAASAKLDGLHSLMVVRGGHVVAEGWWTPYAPELPHVMYSLSKSFTSTAAGLAISEGHFALDDAALDLFPEDAPAEISENLRALKVRHLLSMSVGQESEPWSRSEENWARAFLAHPFPFAPGTRFHYNSLATYMVSALVQKTTGQRILDYLTPRLFAPLGVEGPTWEQCPRKIDVGGWGLNLKTEDIAKFGQLYLQGGVWNGQRLLPEGWVTEATRKHVENGDDPGSDWAQGYGFQFWRSKSGAYRGDGAFGQFCVVIPEKGAVVAITAGLGKMQEPLDLLWEILLPGLGETKTGAGGDSRTFTELSVRTPQGAVHSPMEAELSGKTWTLEKNDSGITALKLDFDADGGTLTLTDGYGVHPIAFGAGVWRGGVSDFTRSSTEPTSALGVWTDETTLAIRLCLKITPFTPRFTLKFPGDGTVHFDFVGTVGFGSPDVRPTLIGQP